MYGFQLWADKGPYEPSHQQYGWLGSKLQHPIRSAGRPDLGHGRRTMASCKRVRRVENSDRDRQAACHVRVLLGVVSSGTEKWASVLPTHPHAASDAMPCATLLTACLRPCMHACFPAVYDSFFCWMHPTATRRTSSL